MTDKSDNIRDRLLAQHAPDPGRLAQYRKEVDAMLEANERRLRLEKWYSGSIWIFAVLLSTVFMLLAGYTPGFPMGVLMAYMFGFLTLTAAVVLLQHFINRSRVELLKELKQIQIEVLELREQLRGQAPR
jgi:hypothetical protein